MNQQTRIIKPNDIGEIILLEDGTKALVASYGTGAVLCHQDERSIKCLLSDTGVGGHLIKVNETPEGKPIYSHNHSRTSCSFHYTGEPLYELLQRQLKLAQLWEER